MIKEVLLGLCLALVPVWTAPTETDSGPLVVLNHGRVRGQYMKVKGSDNVVEQYLGIPYAQPPIGPLRLAAPKPIDGWEGIRNAIDHPVMCLQDPDSTVLVAKAMSLDLSSPGVSEDCLYLNVYTPSQRSNSKLPVLVWIHGGGLVIGGASMYDGSPLAAYENIVVVVIQYRLGILGYFSSGDKHAPGNYGFLDQIASLQWVQQNIASFGGDPQSVTIAGESAGGISASLLTLSPMAKGLFHRAVFESGVATLTVFSENSLVAAKMVANVTECGFESTELLVKCLKELTETQIINATKKNKHFLGATVDGEFLKNTAEEVLKSKDFQKVPVLLGITNHEFGWILPGAFASPGWEKGMNRQSVKAVLDMFNRAGASGANEIIMDEYLKDAKTPEDIRNAFTEMLGDIFMVIRVIKVADYHRDAGVPVYMYEFQHRPSVFKDLRPSFVKADHADDVGFVFGSCFWNGHLKIIGTPSEEENQLCKTVMGYWANFVRSCSPNGPGLVHWPVYDQSEKYMNLGLNQAEGQGLKKDKLHFFNVELPKKLAALHAA